MAGLDPAIHARHKHGASATMDGRVKPGHDDRKTLRTKAEGDRV
jgi:hypothetical protein